MKVQDRGQQPDRKPAASLIIFNATWDYLRSLFVINAKIARLGRVPATQLTLPATQLTLIVRER